MARKPSAAKPAKKPKRPRASRVTESARSPLAHARLVHGFLVRLPAPRGITLVLRSTEGPNAALHRIYDLRVAIDAASRALAYAAREGPGDDSTFH
jgi:hypothetical protein